MNRLYATATTGLLTAGLDLDSQPLAAAAGAAPSFNVGAANIAEVPELITDINRPVLPDCAVVGNALHAGDILFTFTGSGVPVIKALHVYRQADGLPVAYIDTRPDLMPFAVTADVPVRFAWAGGVVLTL